MTLLVSLVLLVIALYILAVALTQLVHCQLIGLTGGIATGKTTASHYLSSRHRCPVIDFDQISRAVVRPGSRLLSRIVREFGQSLQNSDGTLNRTELGLRVWSDAAKRKQLNAMYKMPLFVELVRQILLKLLSLHTSIIIDAPLLFESGLDRLCRTTLVVACSDDKQLARLMAREQCDEAMARRRIATQWPLTKKITMADVVIDNDGDDREDLYCSIDRWMTNGAGRGGSVLVPSIVSVAISAMVGVVAITLMLVYHAPMVDDASDK